MKDAVATLASIRLALNDFGPDEVPDVTPRPLEVLARLAEEANEHCAQAHYSLARHDIGSLLAESQASALTVPSAQRDHAFTAAVTTCFVAGVVSSRAGNIDLAATAARRGYDLAQQQDNPALCGFACWYWALELTSMAARTRAHTVLSEGIDDLQPAVQFSAANTLAAEIGRRHGGSDRHCGARQP